MNLLVKRLAHRLERISHDHDYDPWAGERTTPRDGPPEPEPEIVRYSGLSPAPCSVDEAVEEMAAEGPDFHLFVNADHERAFVLYHRSDGA